ncbi:MAG: cache domain-containing protein [Sulfuricurvum sp.]|nr:cache domain-containing protein [Sulfuricurvum sp.]
MNDKNLIRFITLTPIIVIPMIVMIISAISLHHNQEILDLSIKNIHTRLISEQKNTIVSKVNMAIELIEYQRSTIESRLQTKVKLRVDTAYEVAQHIYEQNKNIKSESEIKQMIIDALRPMIWNNGESFIFILDQKGEFALAPKYLRHLEGKSIIDFKDVTGRYVIQEEIKMIQTSGEGFLWDTFTRSGYDQHTQYKQLAYVKNFGHFNWYMGSTEYLDTTTKEIEHTSIEILRNINKNATHYFFIINTDGKDILHPFNLQYEGKNLLKPPYDEHHDLVLEFINKAKNNSSEFSRYLWKNPFTDKLETKLTYVKKIPKTDWIIGTGFYTDTIDHIVKVKKAELIALNKTESNRIILYSVFFSILSVIISFLISMRLMRKFDALHKNIEQSNVELTMLNTSLEDKIEERTAELQMAHDELQKIATTDTLTKIYNRYAFFNILESQIEKSSRYKDEFSLVMFDLDYFKCINDTYGHDVGDQVLIEVVAHINDSLRKSDIFGRIGGEEFMILLPNTDKQLAKEIAERIRDEVSSIDIKIAGHITISAGVVEYIQNDTSEILVKRVDIALYHAKTGGRNRVEIG